MKKILSTVLLLGAFFAGTLLTGETSSAASKFCTAYSYWASCYNTETNNTADYEVTRQDTARALNSSEIEFSSSYYDTSVWSPNYGDASFFAGHWIYEGTTGKLYKKP